MNQSQAKHILSQTKQVLSQLKQILYQAKLTTGLVAINVLVFIPSSLSPRVSRYYGITKIQRDYAERALDIALDNEWWRIFTGAFLHDGFGHLFANMLLLWILGQLLENRLGPARFFCLYFGSLLAGSLGVLLLEDPSRWTVGASGAVFGLLAGALVMHRMLDDAFKLSGLALLLGIQLGLTFLVSGISVGGHVGGAIGGLAFGCCYLVVHYVLRARRSKALADPVAGYEQPDVFAKFHRREVVISSALAGLLGVLCFLSCLWAAEWSVDNSEHQDDTLLECLAEDLTGFELLDCLSSHSSAAPQSH